jgi:hypothetical protein
MKYGQFDKSRIMEMSETIDTFTTFNAYCATPLTQKSVVRRELQELVRDGKLVRVSRGVYRRA